MSLRTTRFAAFFLAAGVAGLASGSTSLKSTMRGWKGDAAAIERMLVGGGAFDSAEAERILRGFAADSQSIVARISGSNTEARDVKARFGRFFQDAQSAVEAAPSRDKLKTAYSALRADCRSCHDVYNN